MGKTCINKARKTGKSMVRCSLFFVFFLAGLNVMMAQGTRTIEGIVSSGGEPLIGAVVREKNTNNASTTDVNGSYRLAVGENAVLEISYVGFEAKEVKTGNQVRIDIELEEFVNVLNEVVAIGYGVQQKKLITGATIQVKGDQLTKQNVVSPFAGLQGLTPGVSIVKNNGKPGEGFKVTIRGAGTIHNAEPLYVIDGMTGGNINSLNPADIESIDILKDAASAAIYGARAANGVILVTTKQARKGRVDIAYDGYYGWQNIKNNTELLGASDYLMMMQEAGLLNENELTPDNIPMLDKINSGEWKGTNWMDEMIRENVPLQNHAININKGTESSAFTLGFSYTSQEPVIAVPDENVKPIYERYTVRLNSEHSLIKSDKRDILKMGETMTLYFSDRRGLDQATGHTTWNDFRNAFKANPLFPAYDENSDFGKPVSLLNPQEINPLAKMYYNSSMKDSKNHAARGNVYLIVEPFENLRWRSNYGFDYSSWNYRAYIPAYDLNGSNEKQERNQVSQQGGMGLKWQIENTLSYDFRIGGHHNFSTLLGSSVERSGLGENFSGSNQGVEYDDFFYAYLGNAKTVEQGRTNVSGAAWGVGSVVSFFGRINYDYQNKYMATMVLRADGSSNFARKHRWGYFPSFSAGWNITEENFMQGVTSVLNHLKLRASWGENGNNRIDSFRYLSTMALANNANSAYYYFGDKDNSPYIGSFVEYLSNPELTWETSRQTNVGFDMMLANNKLGINFDWYHKKTVDWLVQATAPGTYGTSAAWVNGGDIVNKGVELQLNWNSTIGDLRYNVSANMGHNKNEVVRIANGENYIDGSSGLLGNGTGVFYRAEVGQPLGYFLGYKTAGIFQNQEEIDNYIHSETGQKIMPAAKPGDVIFVDEDKNGSITIADRVPLGNPNPDFTYGLNLSLEYKALDIAVNGYGVAGNQIVKSYRTNSVLNTSNYTADMLGRWHGEGTSNRLPSLNGTAINWQYISDLYIEDGDFFRITNITLGFDLKKVMKSLPLNQLRLYVSGQNLFTFTNYSGLDPEVSSYSGAQAWARGIDLGNYPIAQSYLVGVNIRY